MRYGASDVRRGCAILGWGALALGVLAGCSEPEQRLSPESGEGLIEQLGGAARPGFARADGPRAFDFPADHGPHPRYRNEWWYITGNVDDRDGNRFGFQITFFRVGLAPGEPQRRSRWATRTIWMAHCAITDVAAERFHHRERFARGGAMGLAGAGHDPATVWLEDWRLQRSPDGRWRLRAHADGLHLDLDLTPAKAPVLNGDGGWSRKGPGEGQASYYYALPRLGASGWLGIDGERRFVGGRAWLDREWSTSALGPDQAGWDWFALQLDDGTDVMIYRLRRDDGGTSRYSAATITAPNGEPRHLAADAFTVDATDEWQSPHGGTYPAAWRIQLPGHTAALMVRPVLADQELDTSVRYWEGAVDIARDGTPVGRGYVELTGYGD
jgi:predicted secreted hydrolase